MTYDVLNKVSKAELIAWLRQNIFLPPISNDQFLREAKLQKLTDENENLLKKSKQLNQKLQAADIKGNHYEFMQLMIELTKLNDKIQSNSEKINKIIEIKK